eukprot:scaffold61667_cov18-Tisochrysis_lutea.AAC.2
MSSCLECQSNEFTAGVKPEHCQHVSQGPFTHRDLHNQHQSVDFLHCVAEQTCTAFPSHTCKRMRARNLSSRVELTACRTTLMRAILHASIALNGNTSA